MSSATTTATNKTPKGFTVAWSLLTFPLAIGASVLLAQLFGP